MKGREDAFTLLIWIVTLSSFVVTAEVVFTEEPGPGPVLLPVGRHITLNCSVSSGQMIVGWFISVPGVLREYFTDSPKNAEKLASLGITARMSGPYSSQLIINATHENLLTYALCVARIGMNDSTLTQSGVNVTVYGPPDIPTDLYLSVKDGFLAVSWFSYTIPNVSLTFDLALTNLRTFSRIEVTIYDTHQHQFTVEDVQDCDVLEVLVAARNNAGVSSQATINCILPVLPDVNTLKLVLSKDNNGVSLTVTFMMPTPCLVNPVTSYTLAVILESSEQNVTEQTTRSPFGTAVSLEVEGLMEKATYSYSITAINSIGRATTPSASFKTTDVQGVSVCLVEGSTYSIHCSFIARDNNGSMCSYVLVGVVEGAGKVSGTIDENSFVDEEIPNIQDYGRILVYDEDNVLAINKTLDKENITSCSTTVTDTNTATTPPPKMSWTYLKYVIGFILGVALVALIVIIVCATVFGCSPTKEKLQIGAFNKELLGVNDCGNQKEQQQEVVENSSYEVARVDPDPLYEVARIDPNPSYEVARIDPNPSYEFAKIDPNPSYEVARIDPNPSYEVARVDPNPSYEVVRVDPNPSYEVARVDPNPSYEVVRVDPNPSYEVARIDPNPSYEVARVDPNPSYEVSRIERNPSYEVARVDPNPSYEVVRVDANQSMVSLEADALYELVV